ncbi:uncharacterized protein LOC131674079 [Phymastichus coffea]|uniref:uncharacterized protein LOC131674079 n=1 Tax=Phymastichus coffea TaxID=108790 RepID=UPI00273CA353|nr:uncharacterized protein LOC131674079 [Phymastichus coffea]
MGAFVLRSLGIITPSAMPGPKLSLLKCKLLLADPTFHRPGRIDVVIGADIYHRIIRTGTRRFGQLVAQNTSFGWTVMGSAHFKQAIQRFWDLEEVPVARRISTADQECEAIYARGVRRETSGRYVVRLPLKPERATLLGDSLLHARSALFSMQRRMLADPTLRESYQEFMEEYVRLDHIRLLSESELQENRSTVYYVTHHGIWQRSDSGPKLRIVFNASRATSSGISLNDALHAGPKLQGHISTILTRWRRHRYVFCADVQKMFRQVLIDDRDIHLQRIVWSPTAGLPLQHYALRTVTYGTACAPYLALRTMKQLSDDEGEKFPLAREVLQQDLYMDDFLSGGHDLDTTENIRDQLIGLLAAGGFHLRKWVANDPALLEEISPDDRIRPSWVQLFAEGPVRELGVAWDPVEDNFKFGPGNPETSPRLTNRTALAELAGIFDPVGWLTPLTLVAKLLIQDMWRAKLYWDEDLPKVWTDNRWISHFPGQELQLHAFSDASRRVLAAVVYSRAAENGGRGFTTIIGAKSKLASIKSLMPASEKRARMTIPRLELRATLIAAQLLRNAAAALSVPLTSCHLWSDSQVALHWLHSDSPVGHDLIDNYVAHIQELAEGVAFHHVPTDCNPADVATRGIDATQLAHHPLWWKGPAWLPRPTSEWPKEEETVPLATTSPCLIAACAKITTETDYIERFSSLGALLRGTARAIRILRCQEGLLAPVTANELRHAFVVCAKISQRRHFAEELARLSKDGSLQGCHQLKSLEPFISGDGAVHLELVSDLTTASFLGAFTWFVGRRGRPAEVWSDNGTNFRGAALELRRLFREAEIDWGFVEGELAKDGTSWKFIPPSAPHFGGLWEAGVKSMKRHLMRVASPRRLTYEELTTLLVSIEATLNSRPLIPPAGDLDDIEALTPSHFLIGTLATSYPQISSAGQPLDRASHWELVQSMRSHFWARWSREYLNTLLQRSKWKSPQPNLEVGDFVILLDPTLLRPDG